MRRPSVLSGRYLCKWHRNRCWLKRLCFERIGNLINLAGITRGRFGNIRFQGCIGACRWLCRRKEIGNNTRDCKQNIQMPMPLCRLNNKHGRLNKSSRLCLGNTQLRKRRDKSMCFGCSSLLCSFSSWRKSCLDKNCNFHGMDSISSEFSLNNKIFNKFEYINWKILKNLDNNLNSLMNLLRSMFYRWHYRGCMIWLDNSSNLRYIPLNNWFLAGKTQYYMTDNWCSLNHCSWHKGPCMPHIS